MAVAFARLQPRLRCWRMVCGSADGGATVATKVGGSSPQMVLTGREGRWLSIVVRGCKAVRV